MSEFEIKEIGINKLEVIYKNKYSAIITFGDDGSFSVRLTKETIAKIKKSQADKFYDTFRKDIHRKIADCIRPHLSVDPM